MDLDLAEQLNKAIRTLTQPPVQVVVGTVTSVDLEKETCNVMPLGSEAEYFGVRLKGVVDETGKGLLIVPAINSTVLLGSIENSENMFYINDYSEIDTFIVHVNGGAKIEIKDQQITFNGGDFGGLVKVQPLIDKINRLENQLNSLYALLKTHVHPVVSVGSPTGISPNLAGLTNINLTQKNELENEKIKQ